MESGKNHNGDSYQNDGNEHKSVGDMADVRTLPLIGQGNITLTEALDEEDNMLYRLAYPKQRLDFFIWAQLLRNEFAALVHRDLGLSSSEVCELAQPGEWIHGSFNVCIPVYIHKWKRHPGKRVLLRLPLSYKTGEQHCPGNTNEKLRTEAATYIWMQQNSPDVPIPYLWAFGLPDGQSVGDFLRLENAPFTAQLRWWLRRILYLFIGTSVQHQYVSTKRATAVEHGYLIIDYIESKDETMLSEVWNEGRANSHLRQNLFHNLARIMLSLSRLPLPRIGSWTIDGKGRLSLTNRPLLHHLQSLENQGIPTGISRTRTYDNADAFYADLLSCHDSRILCQPNSILDEEDGQLQMASLFAMRGLARSFTDPNLRHGPFAFTLTDLHASNIFIDKEWNIKHLIDLEWACSLPLEMQVPPYWVTNRGVDQIYEEDELEEFDQLRREFMRAFADEEKTQEPTHGQMTFKTHLMENGWHSGKFWYLHALLSPKGCYNLFRRNIKPFFTRDIEMKDIKQCLSPFWGQNAQQVVKAKLADKDEYEKQIREVFANSSDDEDDDD